VFTAFSGGSILRILTTIYSAESFIPALDSFITGFSGISARLKESVVQAAECPVGIAERVRIAEERVILTDERIVVGAGYGKINCRSFPIYFSPYFSYSLNRGGYFNYLF